MISGANEESLIIATARANIILKLNNTNEYKSWIILDNYIDKLEQENKQLKEQLEKSEKARKEAIEFINGAGEMASYTKSIVLYGEEIEELLEILDIDKGE